MNYEETDDEGGDRLPFLESSHLFDLHLKPPESIADGPQNYRHQREDQEFHKESVKVVPLIRDNARCCCATAREEAVHRDDLGAGFGDWGGLLEESLQLLRPFKIEGGDQKDELEVVHQDLHVDARQVLRLRSRVERRTNHECKEANDQDEHQNQLDYV
jgi:hypothetical protein